jgi:hypothetical protein
MGGDDIDDFGLDDLEGDDFGLDDLEGGGGDEPTLDDLELELGDDDFGLEPEPE